MKLNNRPAQLRVGQKVTTEYEEWRGNTSKVVRTLTMIGPDKAYGSGYVARADGGDPCPHCKRPYATPTGPIDAAWFLAVEEER